MKIINIFDYDGTLTTFPKPQFITFAKSFGFENSNAMYQAISEFKKTHIGNELQVFYDFYNTFLENIPVKIEDLMIDEKYTIFNPGVEEFFKKSFINPDCLNYLISSGLSEYFKRLEIAKYINGIYATEMEIQNGIIKKITKPMTFERKIEAIKKIMQSNNTDNCQQINYIGDGLTDGPSFNFVHNLGGNAILVYIDESKGKEILDKLKTSGIIIDKSFLADFRENSPLVKYLTRRF